MTHDSDYLIKMRYESLFHFRYPIDVAFTASKSVATTVMQHTPRDIITRVGNESILLRRDPIAQAIQANDLTRLDCLEERYGPDIFEEVGRSLPGAHEGSLINLTGSCAV